MTDVAVVGGGIAGGALAVLLARGGLGVTVLERSTEFVDRVRGETMPPWGYEELVLTGLADIVLRAEGTPADRIVAYGDVMAPALAEAAAIDASAVLPGIPGMLNLSHPRACQELLDAASQQGVVVVRGVRNAQVTAGPEPEVRYRNARGTEQRVRARLVVGADGRSSTVRRQLWVELSKTEVRSFASGVLVEGLDDWPAGTNPIGTWDDVHFLLFPRQDGRARLYLLWDKRMPSRFAGADGGKRMLERMATVEGLPDPGMFRQAQALPGCASYPMKDTWCDRPYVEGAVLIGDAAGYNDPIIGQGLSIAVRDVRLVAEALLGEAQWSEGVFEPYAVERRERMRRLRATAETATRLRADFTPDGLPSQACCLRSVCGGPDGAPSHRRGNGRAGPRAGGGVHPRGGRPNAGACLDAPRERAAGRRLAAGVAGREPLLPLRRRAVRPGLRVGPALELGLDPVVTEGCRTSRGQPRLRRWRP